MSGIAACDLVRKVGKILYAIHLSQLFPQSKLTMLQNPVSRQQKTGITRVNLLDPGVNQTFLKLAISQKHTSILAYDSMTQIVIYFTDQSIPDPKQERITYGGPV